MTVDHEVSTARNRGK